MPNQYCQTVEKEMLDSPGERLMKENPALLEED